MPEPFTVAGADYLEQLLRAAIQVPAAAADPASGRVVARLMVALGAKGEDERLEPYLSCSPGRPSVYDVTCYDEADRPASWVTDLAAGQAIRAAAKFAAARPDRAVTVVARDDTGHERCVLVARGPTATYQFPESVAVEGSVPGPADSAASAWQPDPNGAQLAALSERLASLPTTDEVVTALRGVLGAMTVDLRARLGLLPTTDDVVGAVRGVLSGMTIELDATAMEDVIHAALDELPHFVSAVPTTAPPSVTAVSGGDESAGTEVMGDGPEPNAQEIAGNHIVAVPNSVSIRATPVANQVPDHSAGPQKHRTGHRGRTNPPGLTPHLTRRPPSDRVVYDALALVALSGSPPPRGPRPPKRPVGR